MLSISEIKLSEGSFMIDVLVITRCGEIGRGGERERGGEGEREKEA